MHFCRHRRLKICFLRHTLDCLFEPCHYPRICMRSLGKLTTLAAFLVSLFFVPLSFAGDASADRGDLRPPAPVRQPAATYKIQAGIDGEIYPVFANYASLQRKGDRTFGVVSVTLSNTTAEPMSRRVSVRIPGWSDQEIQTVEVAPGTTRTVVFAPAFLPRLYQNHEIIAATAQVTITDPVSSSSYETTVPVRLRSAEDMFWGNGFKYASFIASWVTPHDRNVESVLARAKAYTADRRLPGYETWKTAAQQEQETYREA